mmetsp:Transcript_17411/g.20858  ORF Transcript_17411/g.20858 Transcript_17411/m.20858 type:complete len:201 (+) Transcript_17411:165-767(+)
MSTICFGGVCIPYSAILPLIALAFKWIVTKVATLGLLPDLIVQKLGVVQSKDPAEGEACCGSNSGGGRSKKSRSKTSKATTAVEHPQTVQVIESVEDWDNLFGEDKEENLVIVKFTAEWCKPCKAISPVYHKLATTFNATFVEVDVDEMDEIAASMNVAMMPTFLILKGTKKQDLVATVRGANEQNLTSVIEQHVPARRA